MKRRISSARSLRSQGAKGKQNSANDLTVYGYHSGADSSPKFSQRRIATPRLPRVPSLSLESVKRSDSEMDSDSDKDEEMESQDKKLVLVEEDFSVVLEDLGVGLKIGIFAPNKTLSQSETVRRAVIENYDAICVESFVDNDVDSYESYCVYLVHGHTRRLTIATDDSWCVDVMGNRYMISLFRTEKNAVACEKFLWDHFFK